MVNRAVNIIYYKFNPKEDIIMKPIPNIDISYKTISNEIVITNSIVADTFCK